MYKEKSRKKANSENVDELGLTLRLSLASNDEQNMEKKRHALRLGLGGANSNNEGKKEQNSMPEWLEHFLGMTFFEPCSIHDFQKNELNRYCITCDVAICKFCITIDNHNEHELLTIYRHVYQDVVPLCEMEQHIKCKKIQPYKCNKKLVVSLSPLPHKGSGLLIDGNGACTICKRKLSDPGRFRFCSIACKFEAFTWRRIESSFHEGGSSSQAIRKDVDVEQTHIEEQNPCKRGRKGVPHRAPLC